MKIKFASILVLAFAFSFFFSLGFHQHAAADPWWDCDEDYWEGSCCIDPITELRGAWVGPPGMALVCICDGYPGWVTTGGPCNCPMDCDFDEPIE